MRLILFILSLGAALRVFAAAGDAWFLTSKEFARLTPREQKEYLREIQKVVGSLAERSEYFASLAQPKRTVASEEEPKRINAEQVSIAISEAQKWRGEKIPDYQYYKRGKNDEYFESVSNSMEWTIAARTALTWLPEKDPARKKLEKDVNELETYFTDRKKAFSKSIDQDGYLDNTFERMKKARDGERDMSTTVLPELTFHDTKQTVTLNLRMPAGSATGGEVPLPPAGAPAEVKPPEQALPTVVAPAKGKVDAPVPPLPRPKPPVPTVGAGNPAPVEGDARKPELLGYRCMYAGFIVKSDPCRGTQGLPEDAKIKGLNKEKFNCGGDQILCNPLLFGVKRDCELKQGMKSDDARKCLWQSSGVCVAKGKYATRDCAQAGGSDESLLSALELVKENSDAWQEYLTSFYELCDDRMIAFNSFVTTKNGKAREDAEKAVRDDVDQTCGYARKRLKEISDKYRAYDISARPEKKKAAEPSTSPAPVGPTEGKK